MPDSIKPRGVDESCVLIDREGNKTDVGNLPDECKSFIINEPPPVVQCNALEGYALGIDRRPNVARTFHREGTSRIFREEG